MQQMHVATNTSSGDVAGELIEVVPLVMRTIRALMREQRAADLSVPQFRALTYVRRHADTSVSAVAEHLGLSVPAASRLIDALVSRGLVGRQLLASDRRYVTLRLSPEGERTLEAMRAHATRKLAERLERLSPEQRTLIVQAFEPLRALFGEAPSSAGAVREPASVEGSA